MRIFYIFDYAPVKVEFGCIGSISIISESDGKKDFVENDLDFGDIRIHLVNCKNDFKKEVFELRGCEAVFLDEEHLGELHEPSGIALNLAKELNGHVLCFSNLIIIFKKLTEESLVILESFHQEPYID